MQSSDDISKNTELNDKNLELCEGELKQIKDSFLRLNADFDNYKKRVAKEKSEWITSCQSDILLDLLPIVDDFDRAFSEYNKSQNNKEQDIKGSPWIAGFELIHKALYKFLDKYGVKEIKDNINFDPEYHEAIAQVESPAFKPGQIVEVVQKGFMIKDRVLQPAKVIVAK